jgi:hypothetical protein
VRIGLLVDGFQLIAGRPIGDAEAFGCCFQRFLAEQAVGKPCLCAGKSKDACEPGGDGGGARLEVNEDNEALSQREAFAHGAGEARRIGDDRAAVPSRQHDRRLTRLRASQPDQIMQSAVERLDRVPASGDDAAANNAQIGAEQAFGRAIQPHGFA